MADALDRYAVVGIQTAFGSAADGDAVRRNLDRVVALIEGAVWAYSQWGAPVRLICLPEFCLQGIPYYVPDELERHGVLLAVDGPELARLARVAREHDLLVHCGTILERDEAYPGVVFNTAVVVDGDGVVLRYRKVNSWIPIETFASPHLLEGYDEELFPVADTPLGRLACLTCYDALFPETYREVVAKGAEVVLLANALPNPWQTEAPTPWMTIVPQVRSLENAVVTVNVNQGGDLAPFQFDGGSAVFDWEGRVLAQTLQRGEQLVYARVDLAGLREWRRTTYQHLGPAHLRSDAYAYLSRIGLRGGSLAPGAANTLGGLRRLIDEGRERWLGGGG
jgi:predicted amidohydrolase